VPLPFPTLGQAAPGNIVTSAMWNNNVYNGLTFLGQPPHAILQQNATQSFANATQAALTFDGTIVDTYGGHSNVTNNTRYTAQEPGYYEGIGWVCWAVNATGPRSLIPFVNGSAIPGQGVQLPASATFYSSHQVSFHEYFNVGDYVEIRAEQDCGASLSTVASSSFLMIRYLGLT
jgi:hypothetical protein